MIYTPYFFNGGFILVSDYVRMEVTQIGASWDVVAGVQTGLLLFKCA